jgi:hypothetical protein
MFLGRTLPERYGAVAAGLACAAIVSLAAGCGGDAETEVLVRLTVPEGDAVLASLESLELYAERGGLRLAFTQGAYAPGLELELPPLPRREGIAIAAEGRAGASTIAYGSVQPRIGEDDERCCVAICFCSPAAHDAGACTCGDDACGGC